MAKILVVDDEPEINNYVALALRLEGHETFQAYDGRQAIELLEEVVPDLILSDMQMPVMGGLEMAQLLREAQATETIPIIFVTGRQELEYRVRGLEYAVDYIIKPFATPELLARVRAALRLRHLEMEMRATNEQLALANEHLARANEQLELLALTDELTRICNRRGFDKWLEDELWRARRLSTPVALLMFDLDHFKDVNDTWGHAQGDAVLQEFALLLRNSSRHIDIVARFGGEEFAVVLPSTDLEGALIFAEKARLSLDELRIDRVTGDAENLSPLHVTTSGGGAVMDFVPSDISIEELGKGLIQAADRHLYQAKAAGRNAVVVQKYQHENSQAAQLMPEFISTEER